MLTPLGAGNLTLEKIKKLVTRFELAAGGLQNRCSTTELHQRDFSTYTISQNV